MDEELFLTESFYHEMIGRFVAAAEMLKKHVVARDKRIAELEAKNNELEAQLTKKVRK